jgi:hypothetical protein
MGTGVPLSLEAPSILNKILKSFDHRRGEHEKNDRQNNGRENRKRQNKTSLVFLDLLCHPSYFPT